MHEPRASLNSEVWTFFGLLLKVLICIFNNFNRNRKRHSKAYPNHRPLILYLYYSKYLFGSQNKFQSYKSTELK